MRLGLFGGSFDPVHAGHVAFARAARRALSLDRVLFLPTAEPPHKPAQRLAPPLARYTMVELALLAEEGLFASPEELTPGRPAYTADTLGAFRAALPEAALFLLVGADSFAELAAWRRWREIVAGAELAVAVRPGWDLGELAADCPPEVRAAIAAGRVHFLANEPLAWSSRELRAALARGEEPPAGSLAPLVLDFIRKYDPYR